MLKCFMFENYVNHTSMQSLVQLSRQFIDMSLLEIRVQFNIYIFCFKLIN